MFWCPGVCVCVGGGSTRVFVVLYLPFSCFSFYFIPIQSWVGCHYHSIHHIRRRRVQHPTSQLHTKSHVFSRNTKNDSISQFILLNSFVNVVFNKACLLCYNILFCLFAQSTLIIYCNFSVTHTIPQWSLGQSPTNKSQPQKIKNNTPLFGTITLQCVSNQTLPT